MVRRSGHWTYPVLNVIPAQAGTHFRHGHRPSPLRRARGQTCCKRVTRVCRYSKGPIPSSSPRKRGPRATLRHLTCARPGNRRDFALASLSCNSRGDRMGDRSVYAGDISRAFAAPGRTRLLACSQYFPLCRSEFREFPIISRFHQINSRFSQINSRFHLTGIGVQEIDQK